MTPYEKREILDKVIRMAGELEELKLKLKEVVVDPPDVAKEEWEVVNKGGSRFIQNIYDDLDVTIASVADRYIGRPDQIDVMVCAPELLAKLEAVAKGAVARNLDSELVITIPTGLLLDINEVIKKARGE